MNAIERLAELHDIDLLLEEACTPAALARLAKLGFAVTGRSQVERARARVVEGADRRGLAAYERARARYGRGMFAVRDRACQGCFIRLPTAALPAPHSVQMCESCSRVLFWI